MNGKHTCYKCGNQGHIARSCRLPRRRNNYTTQARNQQGYQARHDRNALSNINQARQTFPTSETPCLCHRQQEHTHQQARMQTDRNEVNQHRTQESPPSPRGTHKNEKHTNTAISDSISFYRMLLSLCVIVLSRPPFLDCSRISESTPDHPMDQNVPEEDDASQNTTDTDITTQDNATCDKQTQHKPTQIDKQVQTDRTSLTYPWRPKLRQSHYYPQLNPK